MLFRSRAPVRIDFAGGWTDVALFAQDRPGYVINAALNIYSFATIRPRIEETSSLDKEFHKERTVDRSLSIYSSDYDAYVQAEDVRRLEYDGNIDLVKAAIKRLKIEQGFDMITQSVAPPGSGLGTSASMGVALIAVLSKFSDKYFLKYEMAELASVIETEELGILGGKQDHYASALGGISFMEFRGADVKASSLDLSPNVLFELEKNLVLCYTGKSRLSGDIHSNVTGAFKAGQQQTVDAINELKDITLEMKTALLREDLDTYARLLNENWKQQKRLHPSVTNEDIDGLFDLALDNGALGGKACGAGGGGCLLFYCAPEKEHKVRQALEAKKIQIIDFNFDNYGAVAWKI